MRSNKITYPTELQSQNQVGSVKNQTYPKISNPNKPINFQRVKRSKAQLSAFVAS